MNTSTPSTDVDTNTTKYVLELHTTEWVVYGKGPRHHSTEIVAAACLWLDMGLPELMDFPFTLDEGYVEYERRTTVAWRFRLPGRPASLSWRLADNEEEAIAASKAWVAAVPRYSNTHKFENGPIVRTIARPNSASVAM